MSLYNLFCLKFDILRCSSKEMFLSKDPIHLGFPKRSENSWTEAGKETLEHLLWLTRLISYTVGA